MDTKMLEIRDSMTYIAVACVKLKSDNALERYHLHRAGFGEDTDLLEVIKLDGGEAHYDAFDWGSARMREAHRYIEANFDKLNTGDVVDIQYILGETQTPKKSEFYYEY